MSIEFNTLKQIISINFYNKYENSECTIIILLHNKTYNIIDNSYFGCCIKPDNCDSNNWYNTNWDIFFDIRYSSGCELTKEDESKYREFMKIPSTIYNTLYAFFIYNKYYTIFDNIKQYNMIDTIYTYKLFNCRDLYRISAFI